MKYKITVLILFTILTATSCLQKKHSIAGAGCNIVNDTDKTVFLWYQVNNGPMTQSPITIQAKSNLNIILQNVSGDYSFVASYNGDISDTNKSEAENINIDTSDKIKIAVYSGIDDKPVLKISKI